MDLDNLFQRVYSEVEGFGLRPLLAVIVW
jgi:hypothetical protein